MSTSPLSAFVLKEPGESVYIRQVYGETLVELGKQYDDLVVLDADLTVSTKTALFGKAYPDRFFTMGVSEQDMMGTAAGFALSGKRPFASTFAVFATGRAWEHIRQSIAFPNLNVKIVATHAGVTVGEDGATHQALEDVALMRVLPNMTVIVPADPVETEQVIRAMVEYRGPAYVRLARIKFPTLFDEKSYRFEVGRAVVLREGGDVAIFAMGIMVSEALSAARILEEEGIEASVVNVSTLKPLDVETVTLIARKTGAVVTAEDHSVIGGLGGAIAETLGEACPTPMRRIGMKGFGTSGNGMELLEYFGLKAANIVAAVHDLLNYKPKSRSVGL